LSLLLVVAACTPPAPAMPTLMTGPLADVAVLASPAFGGREHGTAGNDSAAVYLARRYEAMRLRPAFRQGCGAQGRCSASYFQWFNTLDGVSHNVGAIVEGRDSLLRNEYIVIGAHFDHLGYSPLHSLDGYRGAVLRPGADDNASGTAAVLELAERLGRRPPLRSILVLNFDAEEEGMWGSRAFIASSAFRIADLRFMLNLDMIGRLRNHHLNVQGVPEGSAMRARIDSVARAEGLEAHFVGDQRRSDHASFVDAKVPIAMFTTGEHADYHTSFDVASRINGPGLLAIIDLAESIVRFAADE